MGLRDASASKNDANGEIHWWWSKDEIISKANFPFLYTLRVSPLMILSMQCLYIHKWEDLWEVRTPLDSEEMLFKVEFIWNSWKPIARDWTGRLNFINCNFRRDFLMKFSEHHYQWNVFTRWLGPISIRPYLVTPVPPISKFAVCVFYRHVLGHAMQRNGNIPWSKYICALVF